MSEGRTAAQLLRVHHRETRLHRNARFDAATEAERNREGSGFFCKALPSTSFGAVAKAEREEEETHG